MIAPVQKDDQKTSKTALEKWYPLYAKELTHVDQVIQELLQSEASLIPKVAGHIVSAGGKRLRPILTILSSKLCQYQGDQHIHLAACIEFIHTATLLHDDVVDESDLRRGSATANHLWGNAASVLVGDFLLSRAFQLMSKVGSVRVIEVLSDTSSRISEGEVKQLMMKHAIYADHEVYIDIISAKTAQLFSAACRIGAVIAKRSDQEEQALAAFGLNLGIAFQIIDDALDYSARQEELGKAIGDDFREGKVTLPVLLAYNRGNEEEKAFWQRTIVDLDQKEGDFEQALSLIQAHQALEDTMQQAKAYSKDAISALESFDTTPEKQALLDLLEFSVNRPY